MRLLPSQTTMPLVIPCLLGVSAAYTNPQKRAPLFRSSHYQTFLFSRAQDQKLSADEGSSGLTANHEDSKGRKSTSRKAKAETTPIHWMLDSDEPIVLFRNTSVCETFCDYGNPHSHRHGNATNETELVRFVIRGAPKPLVRHRVSTMRMYNPSAKAQDSFRKVFKEIVSSRIHRFPVFPTQGLVVSIAFRMKRPRSHFRSTRPGPGRLRASAPPQTSVTRSDVDNLAKFVLDSLNGLMYDDDVQVCSLHATKYLDNEGECLGATEVCVRVIEEGELSQLVQNSLNYSFMDYGPKYKAH